MSMAFMLDLIFWENNNLWNMKDYIISYARDAI